MLLMQEDISYIIDNLSIKPLTVVQAGSSTLPIIKNPHDIDWVILFDTEESAFDNIRAELQKIRAYLIENKGYSSEDLCFIAKNTSSWLHQKPMSRDFWDNEFLIPNVAFEHFWILYYGEHEPLCDILGKDREIYINSLKRAYNYIQETRGSVLTLKYWYYIYLGCCIILNNSFDNFTEEQINDINALHDLARLDYYKVALKRLQILINKI